VSPTAADDGMTAENGLPMERHLPAVFGFWRITFVLRLFANVLTFGSVIFSLIYQRVYDVPSPSSDMNGCVCSLPCVVVAISKNINVILNII